MSETMVMAQQRGHCHWMMIQVGNELYERSKRESERCGYSDADAAALIAGDGVAAAVAAGVAAPASAAPAAPAAPAVFAAVAAAPVDTVATAADI